MSTSGQIQEADIVQISRDGAVAIVALNYPKRRNAFSLNMRQALLQSLTQLMHHDECRAIVLTGADGTFCAGGDISEMKARTVLEYRERNQLPLDIFKLMVQGPKAIVAAVEGVAMGAGVSLAAASDYVVSASNARFACAFVRVGLMPDTGLFWSLSQRVGGGKARELMLTAQEFSGDEAVRIGFANQQVESGQVLAAALSVAQCYAQMPPLAIAHLKTALATGIDSLDEAIETEVNLQPILRRSQDHLEATKAFMEKRPAVFVGN
ncbi:enoyl-CoA hydratase/isomerase family protein [Pseudomonas sp. CG7]|uniref:enoyl-CoA hydratase/isomerase family protein n=1 Tax=Pseudomonas sp. CG7 TaxID=191007 RepID=UPI002033FE32|nr:enoyl-CoA hydratase/isomerase family protein [Pseudomonas sp. CG7]MCM2459361.1 enoyl-CoA hydratase/isomerase family protein [Pseudomonas sp. CG7]